MELQSKNVEEERQRGPGDAVPFPPVKQVLGLLVAVLVLALIVGGVLGQFLGHGGALISYLLFVLIPPLLIIRRRKWPFRRILGLRQIDVRAGLACLVMALPLGLLLSQVDNLIKKLIPMPEFWRLVREQAFSWRSPTDFLILAFWVVLIGPVCEEVLFRGYALSGFRGRFGARRGVVFTAILFGVFHLDPWLFIPTVMIGTLLGFLVIKTGSIYSAMLVHGANNLLSAIGLWIRKLRGVTWLQEGFLPLPILIACLATLGWAIVWLLRLPQQSALQETRESTKQ